MRGLPGDVMHDILEGILQYEAKELLKHAIFHEKFLSLDELNDLILQFDFGYSNDKSRPSAISLRTLNTASIIPKMHYIIHYLRTIPPCHPHCGLP